MNRRAFLGSVVALPVALVVAPSFSASSGALRTGGTMGGLMDFDSAELALIRERYKQSTAAWNAMIPEARQDLRFVAGEQW